MEDIMNDVNKFSNLQTAMGNMSALQNLVIGMPSTQNTLNISPEVVKQMQWEHINMCVMNVDMKK